MSQHSAFAPARRLGFTIGGFGLLVVLLLGVGTYLLSRRIARPILAITETATAVTAGDLTREAPVTTHDEVGVLATAFNTMTAELRETLEGLEQRVAERTEELRLQNAELGALHETTLGVMHRLDVDDLLRELLERACELLGTPHGYIYVRSPDGEEIENRVATGVFEEDLGARMSLGEGVAGRVWQSGSRSWSRLRRLGGPETIPARPHPRARRRAAAVGQRRRRHARRGPRPLGRAAVRRLRGRAPAALRPARLDRARQRAPVRVGARGA